MTTTEFHTPPAFARSPSRTAADLDFDALSVPYDGQTHVRLIVTSGMTDARVVVDPAATDLIAVRCDDGPLPRLRLSGSELRLSWPASVGDWLLAALTGESRDVEIVLHPAVEWALQIRGGLSRFDADLTAGKLARLEISGGVSDALIDLPSPSAVAPIRISGGVSELALRRPADVGVTLAVSGGVSNLCLDDQSFDAIGGGVRLGTKHAHVDAPLYALQISGGASSLHVVPRSPCVGDCPEGVRCDVASADLQAVACER